MGETAVITGVKAGLLGALTAYFLADTHTVVILMVGVLGGATGYYREVTHLEIRSTLPKMLSEFLVTIPIGVSLALLISEIGGNLYPMKYGWIAVSFIVAIHGREVLKTITPIGKSLLTTASEIIISAFKGK